ncbi:GNAT family N-acetyltransferase [Tateyamaria omphalii]|uniref:GNAT family N-acetyltransferase n=1 Tax=Tateyamaria omphalii TaxID=299262 RepID=UPI001C9929D3|nr:GNAT family N-acetyltransferase [Tateyamaria omphalii]MBY5933852.1 GNAT family N-acetyltransferase [Tateyamaria omphalii]
MTVRALTAGDTKQALDLYRDLVGDAPLGTDDAFAAVVTHTGTTVLGVFSDTTLVAMATLHILPNVTQGGRPYALVENVVTQRDHRGTGQGRRVMQAVIDAAWAADCYKIMLLTGRTADARGFYEKLGFGADEKWGMTIRRAPVRN